MVDAGNIVSPSDPGIVVITQLQPITVIFTLPEDAVRQLPVGQPETSLPVLALARDRSSKIAAGTLTLVDNRIDPATGMVKLKATFDNKDRALKPGQFVVASLHLETLHNVIALPSNAVQQDPNGSFVYVIQPDQTAEKRRIDVARNDGTVAVIGSGINAGEQVVLDGQYGLKPGAKVVIQPTNGAPGNQLAAALPGLP
jgi:membrane fusion protein, multidrug efflux system